MREIEIKARVKNQKVLHRKLEELNITLGPSVKQHDVVYGFPGVTDNAPGSIWLRIRTENDRKTIFTLKKQHTGSLDSIEHETEVSDASELEKIIQEMGYELYSDLTKIRRKSKQGDIELCLDELPGLGVFIEAEKIVQHDSDHEHVVKELWGLFDQLGIEREDEETDGYDVLECRQRGL